MRVCVCVWCVLESVPHRMLAAAVLRSESALVYEVLPGAQSDGAVAAAAFDVPEFISGLVKLVPGGQKEEESTNRCTQVFVVLSCQPRALRVEIDHRCAQRAHMVVLVFAICGWARAHACVCGA